jgi:3D (Asp-Asp-Asp) domain-containing protein
MDGSPCIAADNTDICQRYQQRECIAASNAFPLGKRIYVDKLGKCTMAGRIAERLQNRIDVFMDEDVARARRSGVRP